MAKGGFDDFARMHAGPVDGTAKEFFKAKDTMTIVQPENGKHLMFERREVEFQELTGFCR